MAQTMNSDGIKDLRGFGGKSQQNLAKIGINTVAEFMDADAFDLYKRLKENVPGTSLNFIYGIIAAQENKHWHQVMKEQKTDILFRLDDMGLTPKS
jgi:DNA transformation protein